MPEGEPARPARRASSDHADLPRPHLHAVGRARALLSWILGVASRASIHAATQCTIDEQGYVWFAGRADEIIKIAAHRIGAVEVERAFLRHPAVAEAGVTGRPDELRGEVVAAFVVLSGPALGRAGRNC